MYLKRLQTVGFKSFAERIDVHFNNGVTAIVGPNGSGKSNIIDAVRWVLGEQSARSLRGQRMEDVIFQGSDTRNAMNFAEVTLTLDNASKTLPLDYEEVSVTRRVFRSGESEFFINKQPSRLKDIIDLFIDSGLSRDAFSIIGQGKVEEILSSKADERRVIFEEAAGVLKYKQRKEEAQFKLQETEGNLNRVRDIIYEVEQQIEPLKVQAEKARQYNNLVEQLEQIEIRLLITEIEQLHHEWQTNLKSIEEEREIEIKMKTNIQEREAKLIQSRQRLQELDEMINELQNKLLHATEQLEKYEGEKNVLDERLKHFTENKQKLAIEKELIRDKREKIKREIEEENKYLSTLIEQKEKIVSHIKQLDEQASIQRDFLQLKIEDLKSDYIELLNERAALQNERQMNERQIEKLENREKEQRGDYKELFEKRDEINEKRIELEKNIKDLNEDLKQIERKKETLTIELRKLQNEVSHLKEKRYKEIEQMTKLSSRKETLEEMKESYQGYFYGVRELLKAHKNQSQMTLYGTVFDLIDVPHEYVTAIDTILGPQVQHLVVQTEKDAREAIAWLKNENKGRATFLPLEAIQERKLSDNVVQLIKSKRGFIGIASDLININKKFQRIVNHLLGNVIVTRTLRDANEIARLTNRSFRIVTLDGDVVYPGGSMSGGARKKGNVSLFTREKELQRVAEALLQKKKVISQFNTKIEAIKESMLKKEQTYDQVEMKLNMKQNVRNELISTYEQVKMKEASLNNELKAYDLSVKHEIEEKESLVKRGRKLEGRLNQLMEKIEQTENQITELTEREKQLQIEEEQNNERRHKFEISLAEQEERIKSEKSKLNDLQNNLDEIERQYVSIDKQMNDLNEIEKSQELKKQIEQKIKEQILSRDETKEKLSEQHAERAKLSLWIEDEQRDLLGEQKQHEKLITLIQKKEVALNRLDVALDTRLTQLEKQYVTTYERASEQYEKVVNIDQAHEHVNELKYQINRLGTVNLGAIEEYERIVERYNFLTEQQRDLLEAKETLYTVIKEMDEEMIKRFSTTFSQIQEAFADVFKQLFGGGHAKLTLTDEKNILETGIEIVARPPGKKLRTLNLLSGGEKALTAISLLFAILRVRPVPFVILDEVEAALDEANIVRFAKYVKMFSDETQFIVITHRKGTMEEADVLYGVTMQESGVSRLVSVKLEDTEQLVTAN